MDPEQSERMVEAIERQAEATEKLAEELELQNAVLAEISHSVYQVAVNGDEHIDPAEKITSVPSMRALWTQIEDQEFTRNEESDL